MSLLQIPELPVRVDELERRLAALEGRRPILADAIAVPNVYYVTPEGTKKEGEAVGMVWMGDWDREAAYAPQDVVRYKAKTYVCIGPVPAVVGVTGLGPQPGAFNTKNWFLPGGRLKPMGRIAPGEPFGGVLTATDAKFEEYNTVVGDPENPGPPTWVAHCWEFWVKEVAQKTNITGFGNYEGHNAFGVPGIVHGTTGDDGEFNPKSQLVHSNGEIPATELELSAATAFKQGGNERYYLIVWGGTWQEEGALPHQKIHVTLPIPYTLTPGAGIIEGPGNKPPSSDFEHWELVAGA